MLRRALALGGGGPIGIAWESGLIAGLAEESVQLADAEGRLTQPAKIIIRT